MMHNESEEELERMRRRYPGRNDKELVEMKRFLDRYVEIALRIYLEATAAASREAEE